MDNDVRTSSTLTFLGGAGTVTGSKYLVTVTPDSGEPHRIMVDAGMFQGEKQLRELNWTPFPVPAASISDIVLTHAHMDHSGYLPALVKQGFHGHIWCTPQTAKLAEIVLRDAGYLQERDAEHAEMRGYSKHHPALALYDTGDVEQTLPLFRTADFHEPIDLGGGVSVTLYRAGHILGSASVHVTTPNGTLLFSGDLGRLEHPVLLPREQPPGADYVCVESTYGAREHPDPVNLPHEALADAIRRTVQRGGSVLIPAFAVDRTEIVLQTLAEMQAQGRIPRVPIYVNSPMATRALQVYRDAEKSGEMRPGLDPHSFLDLPNLHEVNSTEESMKLNAPKVPSIIISSSGMATGGRVLHHLEAMLPNHRNTIVLTGYQAVGTRGRSLQEGARQLKMHGSYVPVKAEIVTDDEFSVHADGSDLIAWVSGLDPRPVTVFCTHGEADSSKALAERIHAELGLDAVVPTMGETVRVAPRTPIAGGEAGVESHAVAAPQRRARAGSQVSVLLDGVRVPASRVEVDLHQDTDAGDAHTIVLSGTITIHLD